MPASDPPAEGAIERELTAARRRLDAALIAGEVGTFEWDIVADRLYGDANFEALFSISLDSSRSAPLASFVAAIHPADRERTLAMLAHELRTPLTPISNALQTLALGDRHDAVLQSTVALMQRQLSHILRLVDDLVDVSRISRGKIQLRIERVPVFLDADSARLVQVLGNLLNNAAKYTDPGGHVRISAVMDGGGVTLRVEDDGIGIAPGDLPMIFAMFAQVDTSLERSQGGLGLGLTLVKTLVELHGGTISADSGGAGKGSVFVIRLPGVAAAPAADSHPAAPDARRAAARHRFVVAEDNRDAAESLGIWLETMGQEVHLAFDGVEAVAAIERFRPDVAIIDIGMPRLNGYEACRSIRAEPWGKDILLIALTGWSQDSDRQRTAEAGFDRHLVKPLEHAVLVNLLSSLPAR